ncbi:MAG: autotransporter outer membrane beta-barrel domain-containing protein [Candidatus Omnitrophica bacterium]|nr:autotransporter outer membrane beta-barrel domain-containing protein [Candidatus Omnitrophota bacterium]
MLNHRLMFGSVVSVLGLLSLLTFHSAFASNSSSNVTTEMKFGPYASYIKYEEPDVMQETGFMIGVTGEFDAHFNTGLMLGADGSLAGGLVDYESNGTGSIDNVGDAMAELRGKIGYDFQLSETARLTPYVGAGYRYLSDMLGGEVSTTGAGGYDRSSQYFYLPIGASVSLGLQSGWSTGLNVEYDFFIKGQQRSDLGDVVSGLDTVKHDQDEGYGLRASVDFSKKLNNFELTISPFVRYWNIKQSDTKAITYSGTPIGVVSYEPKNNSTEIGMMVGVRY